MLIEKKVQSCNQSILTAYERQLNMELEVRTRRDQMLKEIEEGKDQEFGLSGPALSLGKKKSSKRDKDYDNEGGMGGGSSGIGNFLSGIRSGFLNRDR